MATRKISELTVLSAAELTAETDLLHVVDVSAIITGKNKKTTVQNFLSGAAGTEPLPYKHKEEFTWREDLEISQSTLAAKVWIAPEPGDFSPVARIRMWAGGGGGGGGNNLGNSGGGGGGGCYVEKLFTYTPGRHYAVYIGNPGPGGSGTGGNNNGMTGGSGSASYVCDLSAASTTHASIPGSALHVLAAPGSGGEGAVRSSSGGSGGLGGDVSDCIGDTIVDGAAGAPRNFTYWSDGVSLGSRAGGSGGGSYRGGRGGRGGAALDTGDQRSGQKGSGGGGGSPHTNTADTHLSDGRSGGGGLVIIEYNNDQPIYANNVHTS